MGQIIAILVVMFVINAFMVYAIVRAWERVKARINATFLEKVSSFNVSSKPILNEVKAEETEEKVVVKQKPVYVVADNINETSYKNSDFKNDYKVLKEEMSFNKQDVIKDVIRNEDDGLSVLGKIAIRLKDGISFDTIYKLSTLSSDEQLNVLESSFDPNEKLILNQYLKQNKNSFNSIEFFDYVNQVAKMEDPNFYVKTGWKNDDFNNIDRKVVTVYDEEITEGVKIVHKDKVYDYSI